MNETAVLAGGCFWCTEAIFKRLEGVKSVLPGYAGGKMEDPTYEEVSSGETGYAEAIKIEYNPNEIDFATILDVFWHTHDPTTMNRQGNDVGPQYRSAIFYMNDEQKIVAEKSKSDLEKTGIYKAPIVTEITPYSNFFEAEDYHKNYFETHRNQPYCNVVISPKISKLLNKYGTLVKEEYKQS